MIAFQSYENTTASYDIRVVNPDGTGAANLTPDGFANEIEPSWSPDARRIAFASDRAGGAGGAYALYVMNADGSAVRKLVTAGVEQHSPAWSPDGRLITFRRCTAHTTDGECRTAQIAVVRPDGRRVRNVTRAVRDVIDSKPAWSPNGKQIVFSRTRDFGAEQIWVIGANGKGLKRLLQDGAEIDHNPSWAPNGRRIAFASHRAGTDGIFVMNTNGKGVRRVIAEFVDPEAEDAEGTGGVANPVFSPSGTRIVFVAGNDLWMVNVSGGGLTRLTEDGDEADWARAR
jgi:Tol biopolymer transport system component